MLEMKHINSDPHLFEVFINPANLYIQDVRDTVQGWRKSRSPNQKTGKQACIVI